MLMIPIRGRKECRSIPQQAQISVKDRWRASAWHDRALKLQQDLKGARSQLNNDCLIPPTSFKSLIDHRRDVNRAKAIFEDMVRTAQVLEDMHLDKGTTWSSPNISKARATFVSGETLQALKNAIFAHQDLLDTMEALYPGSTTRVWCGAGRSGTYSTHIRMHAEAQHEQNMNRKTKPTRNDKNGPAPVPHMQTRWNSSSASCE